MLPLLLAAGGAMLYQQFKNKNVQGTNSSAPVPGSHPTGYTPSQPSQRYPWQPIAPPRVDNKNQPWYNSARDFMATPGAVAGVAGNVTSVVHNLGDVWGQMSDFFGGDSPKADLQSTDEVNVSDADWGASSDDQSNVVGDMQDSNVSYEATYPEVESFGGDNFSEYA